MCLVLEVKRKKFERERGLLIETKGGEAHLKVFQSVYRLEA